MPPARAERDISRFREMPPPGKTRRIAIDSGRRRELLPTQCFTQPQSAAPRLVSALPSSASPRATTRDIPTPRDQRETMHSRQFFAVALLPASISLTGCLGDARAAERPNTEPARRIVVRPTTLVNTEATIAASGVVDARASADIAFQVAGKVV